MRPVPGEGVSAGVGGPTYVGVRPVLGKGACICRVECTHL